MTKSRHFLFTCWLTLALALLPALRAQEPPAPPAAPPPATEPATPAETPAAEKAAEAPPADDKAVTATDEKKDDSELRELGTEEQKPATTSKKKPTRRTRPHTPGEEPHFGDQTIAPGAKQTEAVSIFGNTTVDADLTGAAVSVFGNTTVNGSVGDAAVSVFGTTTINGKVKGEVVAVMGDVVLGPDAEVTGEIVAVLGKVVRSPGAKTHSSTQQIGGFGPFGDFGGLHAYFDSCVKWFRPLAFDSRVLWAWGVAFGILAFYALIALIAPGSVNQCVETLEQRPGYSLLSALLTMLLTPVAFILLALTLFIAIGFVLIPLFALGLFFASIFGKIVILAWIGRRFTNLLGDSPLAHPFFGVLLGGLIMLGLYTIPFAGFVLYKLMGILGLGVVVYTIIRQIEANRPPKPVRAPIVPPVTTYAPGAVPAAAGATAGFAGGMPEAATVPPPIPTLPPVVSAATLPRVGFWLRIGASLIDAIVMGMICGFLSNMWEGFGVFPFWFALYCVVMWANKGTTIGGIICGLKVVRLDDRPLDWTVAIVRALGGFLSMFVAGLGFIWVAFDDEKQSWHDKIAGTTIVRVPKGVSLL